MAVDEQRKGARPEYVRQGCDDSLRRLGNDHIDLYQVQKSISTDDYLPTAFQSSAFVCGALGGTNGFEP